MSDDVQTSSCCPTCGQAVRGTWLAKAQRVADRLPLTPRQLDTLLYVAEFRDVCGYAPTLQEIADRFDCTKVSTWEMVGCLLRKGALRNSAGKFKARALEIG